MYHMYHTHALVLGSTAFGEANKIYTLFTDTFGVVRARAQGVRALSSKQRFGLADGSYTEITLVRGKDMWHIASVIPGRQFLAHTNSNKRAIIARILFLLRRFLPEEEKTPALFNTIQDGLAFITKEQFSRTEYNLLELLANITILRATGYLAHHTQLETMDNAWSREALAHIHDIAPDVRALVQEGLQASHL